MISGNYLLKDVITPQSQFYGADSKSVSLVSYYGLEINKIKQYLARGLKPIFPSKNNWFLLGGESFNGFTRKQIERLMSEFENV